MRKIILIAIFTVLMVLAVQVCVFADMDAPAIEPYKATIKNVNGAKCYKNNIDGTFTTNTLEYGTSIKVLYEIENSEDNKIYAYINMDDSSKDVYYVELSDIAPIEGEVDVKLDYENPLNITILSENGVEIYTGPSFAYNKTGVIIPKGTEVSKCYYINSGNPWRYVTYNGTSGWVCELYGTIGYKDDMTCKVLTPRTTSVYKDLNSNTVVQKIPANVFITDTYRIDDWSQAIYVTYEGVSGYIKNSDCATNSPWAEKEGTENFTYKVNYPAKMYKEGNTNSEVLVDNIPEETELEYNMSEDIRAAGWIYTTYNDTKGWVYLIDFADEYEQYLENASYPENTDVISVENGENTTNNENTENEEIVEAPVKVSGKQIVIFCITGAVVIALTAFVTITLVNKKKEKNN